MEQPKMHKERGLQRAGQSLWLPGLLCLLVCFLGVSPLYGKQLYSGKSSDIFKENSAKIKDKKLLKGMVKKAKEIKGELTITIMLQCTEIVEPGKEPKEELGALRVAVLKKYFLKHFKNAKITETGITHRISEDEFKRNGGKGGIDMLVMHYTDSTDRTSGTREDEAHEQSQLKERWKKKLLVEYKRITDKHRFLCGQKVEFEDHHSILDSDPNRKRCTDYNTEIELQTCLLRGGLPYVRNRQHWAQHQLERLEMHHKTYDEVYRIAKKIGRKDPRAGRFAYNRKMLEEELQRGSKGMIYLKWAERIIYSGLEFMPKYKESRDPKCNDCQLLRQFYVSYESYAEVNGHIIHYKNRDETVKHLMGLHNYVRRNLGLYEVDDSRLFPICISHSMRIEDGAYEYWQDTRHSKHLPLMKEYGIPEVPLEEKK